MPGSTISRRLTASHHSHLDLISTLPAPPPPPNPYQADPLGYLRDVMGLKLWSKQEEICRKLVEPPHYRVLVKAAHSTGKTHVAAALTSWFYDTFSEGCVITTAPTERDVRDLLWREIRLQRFAAFGPDGMRDFVGNRSPEMRTSPSHYAKGFTARLGESFQGRHQDRMLFVFDEAVGVDAVFWDTTKSMFKPNGRHHWLAIFNPTDVSSRAYQEENADPPSWHVVEMDARLHPNISGVGEKVPAAVDLEQFSSWVRDWCDEVPAGERQGTDVCWPPCPCCQGTGEIPDKSS